MEETYLMNRKSLLWSFILIMMLVLAGCGGQTVGNTAGVTADQGKTTNTADSDNSQTNSASDTTTDQSSSEDNATTTPSITSNSDGSYVVKSAWGETTLPRSPQKIVTLHFSFTDEVVSLGITPVGIAGSYNAEVLGYLKDKVKDYTFVGNHQQPNLEVISSLKPDLIIANADVHGAIRDDLEKIAPTIALYTNGYGDMEQNFAVLGTLLDKDKEYEQVMSEFNSNIEQTHSKITGTPKVMVVKVLEKNFYIWMKTSYIATLLEKIGAEYSFDETKSSQQQTPGKIDVADVDLETLVQENPDYLVIYGAQADLDKWMGNSTFQTINAVKNNHVLVVNDEVWALGKGPLSGAEVMEEALPFFTK
ncbi:ABC transporter substrate-binding protein [Bacillales bacterium AN1005]